MRAVRPASPAIAALLLLGSGAPPPPPPIAAAPVTVTSDSASYCEALARRLGEDPAAPIARLRDEGRSQCAAGHLRGGIIELRRALILLRGPDTPPS